MSTAIIALEGVLKTEVGDPIPEGIKLFRILAEHYRVVIASDMSMEQTDHWLRSNLIIGYGDVYDDRYSFEGQELRKRQIDIAKSKGKVSLFIDPDADYCAYALERGIHVIMFESPKFIRTKRTVKPWEDLTTEVIRQRESLLDAQLGSNIKRWE